MHVCCCLIDIVNGKVNSIMRLVLALAAHYKPNNVRESRHRSSLASYAQVTILSTLFCQLTKSVDCLLLSDYFCNIVLFTV